MPPRKKAVPPKIMPRKKTRASLGSHVAKLRHKTWEPTARQLAIYEAVTRGGSIRAVGKMFSITHQSVGVTCMKIDDWLAQQYMDKIRQLRVRHTAQLEHVYRESMEAWEKSKQVGVTETTEQEEESPPNGKSAPAGPIRKKRQERHQCGEEAFLSSARSALADIRKIWAVDKNPKVADIGEGDEEYRVAGKPREQVIQEQIAKLTVSLVTMTKTSYEQNEQRLDNS